MFISYSVFVIAALVAGFSLGDSYATLKARRRDVRRRLNNIRNML